MTSVRHALGSVCCVLFCVSLAAKASYEIGNGFSPVIAKCPDEVDLDAPENGSAKTKCCQNIMQFAPHQYHVS